MGLGARGHTRMERFHMSLGSEWPCRIGCSLFPNMVFSHSYGSLSLCASCSLSQVSFLTVTYMEVNRNGYLAHCQSLSSKLDKIK